MKLNRLNRGWLVATEIDPEARAQYEAAVRAAHLALNAAKRNYDQAWDRLSGDRLGSEWAQAQAEWAQAQEEKDRAMDEAMVIAFRSAL